MLMRDSSRTSCFNLEAQDASEAVDAETVDAAASSDALAYSPPAMRAQPAPLGKLGHITSEELTARPEDDGCTLWVGGIPDNVANGGFELTEPFAVHGSALGAGHFASPRTAGKGPL